MANNTWKNQKRREREEEWERQYEERMREQAVCSHDNCSPCRWNWDGTVQEMQCNDCGMTNFIGYAET